MTGLILKLAPRERVLINGVVIENCEKRARISIVSPNAHVLRLRDAIHPDDAKTPVSRVCYICQLLITGDIESAEGLRLAVEGVDQLLPVFSDRESKLVLEQSRQELIEGRHYQALKQLRGLLELESVLLSRSI